MELLCNTFFEFLRDRYCQIFAYFVSQLFQKALLAKYVISTLLAYFRISVAALAINNHICQVVIPSAVLNVHTKCQSILSSSTLSLLKEGVGERAGERKAGD